MSLLSFFHKNKQETAAEDSAFYSRAEADSQTVRPRKRKSAGRTAEGADNAPVDPVLPEKKRARRRLVGAVALVLAVIIGLPMVLDSEPKLLADDISIEIPSKEKPAPAVTRALSSDSSGASTSSDSRVPAATALDQKEEVVEAASIAASTPAPGAKSGLPARSHDKMPAKPQEKMHDKPHDKAPDKAHESALPRLADGPGAKADATDANHGKFTVQIAAFASMDKVNELRGRLKEAGISSYTQKVATEDGERIRIRVGPLNSRQDVDRMQKRLAELGLSGKLLPAPS